MFFTIFIHSSNIYWSPTILDVLGKQCWKYRHNIQPDATYSQIGPAFISTIWMHWWTSISSYLLPIDHTQEKEMQKSITAVWGGLTNSWGKKKERAKGKGEKGIARRDKKAFLSDQCKEIEENNRMRKTRDLKKIRDTKETFHAKMGTIKDRNGMDLTKAEDIKKRWQEYTENIQKRP